MVLDGGVRWEYYGDCKACGRAGEDGQGWRDARSQAQVCSTGLSSKLFHYNIHIMKWLKVPFFTLQIIN